MLEYIETLAEEINRMDVAAGNAGDNVKVVLDATSKMKKALQLLTEAEELLLPISEDLDFEGDFGLGIIEREPNDVDKIEWLTNACRVLYADAMGKECTNTNPPDPERTSSNETRRQYFHGCLNSQCDFVYHQLIKYPEDFDVPGYRSYLDRIVPVLKKSLQAFNTNIFVAENFNELEEAAKLGREYLSIRTGKDYTKNPLRIGWDYIDESKLVI